MTNPNKIDTTTLTLIANGEFDYEASTIANLENPTFTKSDYLQLFEGASIGAAKILGQAQDRDSKLRLGLLFKSEGRKKKLTLDIRRFTGPIAMGVFNEDESELFGRVTVTENHERSTQQKPFHLKGYGSVALKLFVVSHENQELEMHRVVTERAGNSVSVAVNNSPVSTATGLVHAMGLIDLTRTAL
ncbi:hypothetical protein H7171_03785 [Candidatus Saccharibacteria bacterium]|nr:hypothetical protein [Candidatus Saccharibacteria bacterium]